MATYVDAYGTWTYTGSNITAFSLGAGVTEVTMPTDDGLGQGFLTFALTTFQSKTTMVSLTIPDCYTSIPAGSSVTTGAFYNSYAMTTLVIGNGVTSIGNFACLATASVGVLANLTIGDHVQTIGEYAFYYCHHLTDVVLPSSVTTIGQYAFSYCGLTSVSINTGVTSIGRDAFSHCSLTSLTIPSGITTIGPYVFYYNTSLTSVIINSNVISSCFEYCTSLTSVTIGSSVTTIGGYMFRDDASLTSITFLGLVAPTSIDSNWLYGVSTSIRGHAYIASNFPPPVSSFNNLIMGTVLPTHISGDWGYDIVNGGAQVVSYYGSNVCVMPTTLDAYTVTSMHLYLFRGRTTLTSISIADTITAITNGSSSATGAFSTCTALTTLLFGNGVITIGNYACGFANSTNVLANITIGTAVTTIGTYAFQYCRFTSITIPNNVTSIGTYAFYYCALLTSMDSISTGVTTLAHYTFAQCSGITSLTIPSNIITIGNYVFYSCTSLTSVSIQEGVTTFGESVFSSCTALTTITFPNSLTTTGSNICASCMNLVTATLGNNIVSYGPFFFSSLTNLTTVYIGGGILSQLLIYGCNAMANIYFTGLVAPTNVNASWITSLPSTVRGHAYTDSNFPLAGSAWNGLTMGVAVNSPYYTYTDNGSNITLDTYTGAGGALLMPYAMDGKSVVTFAEACYLNKTAITSMTISSAVTSIPANAFSGCTAITTVTIPAAVTSIGSQFVLGCTSLTSITVNASNATYSNSASDGILYNKAITTIIQYPLAKLGSRFITPSTVTSIGNYAFKSCAYLITIAIPAVVTAIGISAFESCASLTDIYFKELTAPTVGADWVLNIPGTPYGHAYSTSNFPAPGNAFNGLMMGDYSISNAWTYTITNGVATVTGYTIVNNVIVMPTSLDGFTCTTFTASVFLNKSTMTSLTISDSYTSTPAGSSTNPIFKGCTSLTTLIIGNGVITVNDYMSSNAVGNHPPISTLTLGDHIQTLGYYSFYACAQLTSVTIPDSVITMAEGVFNGCSSLTTIVIGSGLTATGNGTFPTSLRSITFRGMTAPTTMYNNLFISGGASALCRAYAKYASNFPMPGLVWAGVTMGTFNDHITSGDWTYGIISGNAFIDSYSGGNVVVMPSTLDGYTVTSFYLFVFQNKTTVTSITIADTVTAIPAGSSSTTGAFYNCNAMTTLVIGNGVTSIGAYACSFTSSTGVLANLTIGTAVQTIGNWAFYYCHHLTSVTIPNSVTSIGDYAFSDCTLLANIYFLGLTAPTSLGANWITSTAAGIRGHAYTDSNFPLEGAAWNTLTMGTDVNSPYYTYTDNGANITLNTYTGAGGALLMPYAMDHKPVVAFLAGCYLNNTTITSMTIASSLLSIPNNAFSGCTGLTTISVSASVTSIGSQFVIGCSALTSITVNASNATYSNNSSDGVLYNKSITTLIQYPLGKTGSFIIPTAVTTIGDYSFKSCDHLTIVLILANVASIGISAFQDCLLLTNIQFKELVAPTVGADWILNVPATVRGNAYSTSNFPLPNEYFNGLLMGTTLNEYGWTYTQAGGVATVTGYTGIETTLVMPTVRDTYPCNAFTLACFQNKTTMTSLTIAYSYLAIPAGSSSTTGAFYNCNAMTTLVIGNGVITIGAYACAFTGSTGVLANLTIGTAVQTIGNWAFYYCHHLTSVTIPNSVTSIGSYAFEYCTALSNVIIGSGVTTISDRVFISCTALTSITFIGLVAPTSVNSTWISSVPATCRGHAYINSNFPESGQVWNTLTMGSHIGDDGWAYTQTNNIATIHDFDDYTATILVMPTTFAGLYTVTGFTLATFQSLPLITSVTISEGVTAIPTGTTSTANAFYECTVLNTVIMPSTLTTIGAYAFYGRTALTTAVIPTSVTTIGTYAFCGCTYLTSVTIPDLCTSLGTYAFYGCTRLASVNLGAGVSSLPDYIFYQCIALTSLSMPNSVTTIGTYAVYGCTTLSSINISPAVTTIGSYAFATSNNFTDISIPNSVTTIGINAFQSCTKLVNLTIGTGLLVLQNYLFGSCTALVNVTLPNNVTTINTYCFTLCTGLKTITIGTGLTTIGTYVFNGCTALASITFNGLVKPSSIGANWLTSVPTSVRGHAYTASNFPLPGAILPVGGTQGASGLMMGSDIAADGWLYTVSGTATITGYDGVATQLVTPATLGGANVTAFTLTAFNSKTTVTSITLSDPITTIPAGSSSTTGAFYNCQALTTIVFNNNLTTIGAYACYGLTALYDITWGGVTTIGNYAFRGCTSTLFTTLTIPNAVTTMGTYAFYSCTSLASITIGSGVTSIGDFTFWSCFRMTSLIIGNSVASIGATAFQACSSLTSITIPSSVTTILSRAFYGCTALISITFLGMVAPTSVDSEWIRDVPASCRGHAYSGSNFPAPGVVWNTLTMGSYVENNGWFWTTANSESTITGYDGIDSIVTTPTTLSSFPVVAFSLTAFNNRTRMTSLTLVDTIRAIPAGISSTANAFYGCTNLATIVMGSGCLSIGAWAFGGSATHNKLANITWGGVTSIGMSAFAACTLLTSVNMPSSVTTIGDSAFSLCTQLTTITIPNGITSIGFELFDRCSALSSVTLGTGVTSIGIQAFYSCTALTSITLPIMVTTIGVGAFSNCNLLANIYFLGLTAPTSVGANWIASVPAGIRGHAYYNSNFPIPGQVWNTLTMGSYILQVSNPPTLISASAGSASVALTWTAPTYDGGTPLTAYLVRYSINSDLTNYTELQVDDTVLYLLITEMPSGTYWFGILAQNSVGNSVVSNKLSAQPFSYPDPPILDSATPLTHIESNTIHSFIRLNWTAPLFTGGTALTGYKIYFDESINPPYTLQAVVLDNVHQYDTDNLTPGSLYYFGVSAVNASDESPKSNIMSATPYTVSDAPSMVDLTPGYKQVEVRWQAPLNTGYTTLTNYKVYSSNDYDPPLVVPSTLRATVGGGVTEATITELQGGLEYYFAVKAVNAAGDSDLSDALQTSTPYTEPEAPVLSGTDSTSQVNLSWTIPYDGGRAIDYYVIYQDNIELSTHYPPSIRTARITGLTDNVEYTFNVVAHNEVGYGMVSNTLSLTPHPVPPDAPVISASARTNSAYISWSAPFDGGSQITSYTIYHGIQTPDIPTTLPSSARYYTVPNLDHGVEYIFALTATSALGVSDMSNTPMVTPYTYPGAPTLTSVLVGGDNHTAYSVELIWNKPGDDGSSDLTYYNLYYGTSPEPTDHIQASIGGETQDALITGLTAGLTYYFSVSAFNAAGESDRSSEETAIPYRISDPPNLTSTIPDVVGCLVPKITVSWLEPDITGYTPIISYYLYRQSSTQSRNKIATLGSTSRSHEDTSITAGVSYTYSITAYNGVGGQGAESVSSNERSATSYCVPSAPVITGVTAQTQGTSAIVSWNGSVSTGGKSITKYDILYGTNPDVLSFYASYGSSARTAQISGLTQGTRYYFGVKSYTEWGYSEMSNVASILPDPPILLDAVPHTTSADLTWTAPSYTGGVDVTGYEVYYGTTEVPSNKFGNTLGVDVRSVTVTGLNADTLYYFGLKTLTYVGSSNLSNVKDNILGAPTCYSEFGTNEIIVHWAPNVDGGEPITGYRLYYGLTTNPTTAYSTYDGGTLHTHITNLDLSRRYYFAAKAYNAIADSPSSASVVTPTGSAPTPPLITNTYSTSSSNVTIEWSDTCNNTTYPITGYEIYIGLSSPTGVISGIPATLKKYTISNLTTGATYKVAIKARNVNAFSTLSDISDATVSSLPSSPNPFTPLVEGTSIHLSWGNNGETDIIKYYIYRGYAIYVNNIKQFVWPENPTITLTGGILLHTFANLTPGLEYGFRIYAENGIGRSPASLCYATPVAVPTMLGISGLAGEHQVVLSWSASPNGSAIDYYTIYQFGVALPNTVSITTATLTGLSNDVTYTYTVAAHNAIGMGAQSSQIALTPRPPVPNAPRNLVAIPSKAMITLTWDAPLDSEGVDYYAVYFNGARMAGEPTTTTMAFTASQEYTYTVAAHNSGGMGAQSDPVTMGPLLDTPGKPTLVECNTHPNKVVLVWSANATGMAGPNTGFKVLFGTTNNPSTVYQTYDPDIFTAEIYNLTLGVNYYFAVITTNVAGDSLKSNVRNARIYTTPTVPQNFGRTNGNAIVQLYWSAPSSDGASPILYYNIYKGETAGSLINVSNTTTLIYNDTNVINGAAYYYAVSAVNAAGEGIRTDYVNANPIGEPSKPQIKSAVAGREQVIVVWGPPIQLGGNQLNGFNVYYGTTQEATELFGQYGALATTTTVTGLTAGTRYYFSISALMSPSGETPKCAPLAATPYTIPDAPVLTLVSTQVMGVLLEWTVPDANGSALTGYKVFYGKTTPDTQYGGLISPSSTGADLINLDPNFTYKFVVYAVNMAGSSVASNEIEAKPEFGVCDPPVFSSPTAGASKVTLAWSAPVYTGGNPVTGYQLYIGTSPNAMSPLATLLAGAIGYVATSLTPNVKYYFAIKALSENGGSELSALVTSTPYAEVPDKPTLLTATPTGRNVILTWEPNYDGGAAITYYRVYYGLSASLGSFYQQYVAGTVSTTVTGLTPGVLYYFGVCALNSRGISEASTPLTATVDPNIIGAPTSLTAIAGNKQVTLNWVAPVLIGTSPIQYYTVYMNGNTIVGNPTGLTYIVPNLTNGVYCTFTVSAHNLTVEGDRSLLIGATPKADLPTPPLNLIGTAGNTQAILSWDIPTSDGGATIDYYLLYQDGILLPGTITDVFTTVSSLTNGRSYAFKVSAHNNTGISSASNIVTVIPADVPGVVTNLTAVAHKASVALTWVAPVYTGGLTITGYTIYKNGDIATTVGTTSATISSLTNGELYLFYVVANNVKGSSASSSVVSATPFDTPSAPQNLTGTAGSTRVKLYWEPPTSNGGAAIDYYVIYKNQVDILHTTSLNATIKNLTNGTSYTFNIAAHNAGGVGFQSVPLYIMPISTTTDAAIFDGIMFIDLSQTFAHGAAVAYRDQTIDDYEKLVVEIGTYILGYWNGAMTLPKDVN